MIPKAIFCQKKTHIKVLFSNDVKMFINWHLERQQQPAYSKALIPTPHPVGWPTDSDETLQATERAPTLYFKHA